MKRGEGNQREKEHSQECERKGWWGEKGEEEESRKRRDTEAGGRYKLLFSHSATIFERLPGASPRARRWAYGTRGDRVPPFTSLPFIGRDQLAENRNKSFSIINCDQYCEGSLSVGLGEALYRGWGERVASSDSVIKVTSWRNALPFSRTRCILEEGRRGAGKA